MEENTVSPLPAPFSAELDILPCFNLALQQNAIPFVRELKLTNRTGADLKGIECVFSSAPPVIRPKTVIADLVRNDETLALNDLGVELDYDFLAGLSDTAKCRITLTVNHGREQLFQGEYDADACAPDQWLGVELMPELLASFVTPNLEIIAQLQSQVASELEKSTGDPGIQGYQADRTRVYQICKAIYHVIRQLGIRYANPPSSFGVPGQKIRLPDTVCQQRMGTCLETALLFASLMELCGLHPVILLQTGHAYVGCHLVDGYFPDIPMDDLQVIRKRVDLDEFLVIESTAVTADCTFAEAEATAKKEHLNIDDDFRCAVDVVRARYSGIRPLPLRRNAEGVLELIPEQREVRQEGEGPERQLQQHVDMDALTADPSVSERVARWTQKLLDLSLRNRLLNVRDNRMFIPVACPDITLLEDKIAANESLSLNPLSNLLGEKDLHDMAMLRNSGVTSEIAALLANELEQKRLWTLLTPNEMTRRLTALYRQGRTDLEEGGVNTLFLAIGFLEWKSSPREAKSHLAPVLLIPVRLERRSLAEGIHISRADDETVINETLLELLRSQFHLTVSGVSPLPTDDSGVDVGKVMQIFRQTLRDMSGWELREEAGLGHFSFGKFIMWHDMTSRIDSLRQNPLVNHLIGGGGIFSDGIEVFPPEEVESRLDPSKLYCPVNADGSQLTAVLYSALGKNFVLYGPPGTGKSQTITNIIAHNLALGRKVLFVSEKKAALDVVHHRLSAIGLKPFCLELHSNKSGKSEVLKQFAEALQVPAAAIPGEWSAAAASLESLRDELNVYVRELHRKYPNGLSAYDCFSGLADDGDLLENSLPVETDLLTLSREGFEKLKVLAASLAAARKNADAEALEALAVLAPLEWSPVNETKLLKAARELADAVAETRRLFAAEAPQAGVEETDGICRCYDLAKLAEQFKYCGNLPAAFFCDDFPTHGAFLKEFAQKALRLKELEEKLRNCRLEKFREFDFPGIAARISRNEQSFFLFRFLKNRTLLNEVSVLKKSGGAKFTLGELKALLPDAEEFSALSAHFDRGKKRAAELLGPFWQEEATDWAPLENMISAAAGILDAVRDVAGPDAGMRQKILGKLRELMPEAGNTFREGAPAREKVNALVLAWNRFQETLQTFSPFAPELAQEEKFSRLQERLDALLAHGGQLRNVLQFRALAAEGNACGLGPFVRELTADGGCAATLAAGFDRSLLKTMLRQILDSSPVLCRFNGPGRDESIRKFRETDRKYTALSRRIIFAKLAEKLSLSRSENCPDTTPLGVLKRECEKRARQKPVRQLLEQIRSIAFRLKPCFLMSPLSVAQYLPPDAAPFDLIVFDEASQIPVWDAIGVIARGKQLIVVGDPKQMPPTAFFQKGESDEDGPSETPEDMESILDECIAAGVHPTYLNWHYRSRHEALIAFSNHYYYEDRLMTFPAAADSPHLGVSFRFVPGAVYDRRATRTNRKEAEEIVKYIFERLADSSLRRRSIGVVAFSQAQQNLIEDLVENERDRHPELEAFFSEQNEEPLFVKNLENVQGDERDVILFSIGYAPDSGGRFSMNFGPLNRDGGERRLNVAITRAREQVVVFSGIHGSQIDLSRTGAVGAAHLRYFLEYAEKGVVSRAAGSRDGATDKLGGEIASFLTAQGYTVERNVGFSDCRVDLGVRHPARPEAFLAAIECDGPVYAAQKTVRDRDDLRQSVLNRLGWHTFRVWSVDWAFDRARAQKALLAFLKEAEQTSVPAPKPPAPEPRDPAPEAVPEPPPPAPAPRRPVYRQWEGRVDLPQESFYEERTRSLIRSQLAEVIRQEGPVYESLLKKRVARAWGFARTGGRLLQILDSCLPREFPTTLAGRERVFWPTDREFAECCRWRIPADGAPKRTVGEIPPEELADAMFELQRNFGDCEKETLFRETLRLFGLSSLTDNARVFLEYGFEVLERSGRQSVTAFSRSGDNR